MTRILLYITMALSLASVALSVLTRQKGAELSSDLSSTKKSTVALKGDLSKLNEEKSSALARADEVGKTAEERKAQLEKLNESLKESEGKASKLQAEISEKMELIAKLKKQAEDASAAPPPPPPGPDPAQEQKIASLKAELENSQQTAEAEQKRLNQEVLDLKGKLTQITAKNSGAAGKAGRNGKKPVVGRVVAYNEGWNFVVVDIGDKQGVTPESQLLVKRDGRTLARLRITEVRPSHTSAGLEYPNQKKNELVRPGDTVVIQPPAEVAVDPTPLNVSELIASPKLIP